ncbi:hypothetical protein GCM10009718_01830 [Isoptericola halotolerans]
MVLPATVLLVPGAGGTGSGLPSVRSAVLAQLGRCTAADGRPPVRWGVLGPSPRTRTGRRRPSLAAAGIADRWLPLLRDGWDPTAGPAEHTEPGGVATSVAQLMLAEAVGPGAAREAVVVELAATVDEAARRAAADVLASCDAVVVAGGDPLDAQAGPTRCAPGVEQMLAVLAERSGWVATTRSVETAGPHLPVRYDVVTWGAPAPGPRTGRSPAQNAVSANQPTPVSSSQKRTVRPTRTVGT